LISQLTRGKWFESVFREHKEQFSEIDTLLRALDRFFIIENLPIQKEVYTARNFYIELSIIKDVILRLLSLLEQVIPESTKNAFWFQKYAEQSYASDRKHDMLRAILYRQDSPENSLILLYDSFINLKVIITDILKNNRINYMAFKNYGDIITREIRENRYFNPFSKDINPDFDRIRNPELSRITRSIKDRDTKRAVSTVFILLYRILRYLRHVDIASHLHVSLNCSYVILILIRSEIKGLVKYLRDISANIDDAKLRETIDSLAFQFSIESKRVYEQELRDLSRISALNRIRGRIENCHGILRNLTEQCIVQLASYFSPSIEGEQLFPSFKTRLEQSMKLREDIYVLYELINILEGVFQKEKARLKIFDALKSYMLYFESFTFRLLRYDDYEEFAKFFEEFLSILPEQLSPSEAQKLYEKIHRFKIFLETTLRLISQRTELRDRPIDKKRAEDVLAQFLPDNL